MEFDGGMSRRDAGREAVIGYLRRRGIH
jgi:hypothetical protein